MSFKGGAGCGPQCYPSHVAMESTRDSHQSVAMESTRDSHQSVLNLCTHSIVFNYSFICRVINAASSSCLSTAGEWIRATGPNLFRARANYFLTKAYEGKQIKKCKGGCIASCKFRVQKRKTQVHSTLFAITIFAFGIFSWKSDFYPILNCFIIPASWRATGFTAASHFLARAPRFGNPWIRGNENYVESNLLISRGLL